jgi:hypothetical protein
MVSVTVSLVALLALIAWSFVFGWLQGRSRARHRGDSWLHGNNLWGRVGPGVIVGDHFEHSAQGVDLFEREDRAKAYLRRIVALTGAVKIGNNYVLEIGTTRFQVRDRYVRRLQDMSDSKCEYEETCFYLPYTRVRIAEQIATALLGLANNPALFDRWSGQIGAVKPDGEAFARRQRVASR